MEETLKPGAPAEHPDRRVIEGVPGLAWGRNGDCTFIGSLVAATSVTPFPCEYEATMGATGLAFRVRWFQGTGEARWCPSSPVGEFPEEIGAARKATGWRLRVESEAGGMARLAPDILASITAGLPVLAYDDSLNVAVIFGTEDEGRTVLMHDYFHDTGVVQRPTASLKMLAIFLGEHTEPLDAGGAAVQGIRMAVRFNLMRHDPPSDEEHGYWHGVTALGKWAEDLGRYNTLTDTERASLFMVNWWNFEALADARIHAGPFVRKAMQWFPPAAHDDLDRAARIYEDEAKNLRSVLLGCELFTGPWSGKTIAHWKANIRKGEQELLGCAAEAETNAMAHLEAALATLPQ